MISTFVYSRGEFQEILSHAFGVKLTVCSDLDWVIIGPCAVDVDEGKTSLSIPGDLFRGLHSGSSILLIPACCGPYSQSCVERFRALSPQNAWISLEERFDGLDIVNSSLSWICREKVQALGQILIEKGLVITSDLA